MITVSFAFNFNTSSPKNTYCLFEYYVSKYLTVIYNLFLEINSNLFFMQNIISK